MAISCVAARNDPIKNRMAIARIPQESGAKRALISIIITRSDCIISIHDLLVPNLSMNGPHRNFSTQGKPNREVRPIDSSLTPISLKKNDEIVRIIE